MPVKRWVLVEVSAHISPTVPSIIVNFSWRWRKCLSICLCIRSRYLGGTFKIDKCSKWVDLLINKPTHIQTSPVLASGFSQLERRAAGSLSCQPLCLTLQMEKCTCACKCVLKRENSRTWYAGCYKFTLVILCTLTFLERRKLMSLLGWPSSPPCCRKCGLSNRAMVHNSPINRTGQGLLWEV